MSAGARLFVSSPEFKALNVGVALDEGLANPTEAMSAFYGERAAQFCLVRAQGPTGHGSRFIENTAVEKLVKMMSKAYEVAKIQTFMNLSSV